MISMMADDMRNDAATTLPMEQPLLAVEQVVTIAPDLQRRINLKHMQLPKNHKELFQKAANCFPGYEQIEVCGFKIGAGEIAVILHVGDAGLRKAIVTIE